MSVLSDQIKQKLYQIESDKSFLKWGTFGSVRHTSMLRYIVDSFTTVLSSSVLKVISESFITTVHIKIFQVMYTIALST